MKMNHLAAIVLLSTLLCACGEDEAQGPSLPPDVFYFDSGGAHHFEGFGAWRIMASRGGRFQASHEELGKDTNYDEVQLAPPERATLWAAIDAANLDTLTIPKRPGVPDEVQLVFRLEMSTGESFEVGIWRNDLREQLALQPLLQELRVRIEETYGAKPVF